MIFFIEKTSFQAAKSAVDDIFSLVNDVFALEKVPWITFFLQKPSFSAIKSAVDDILSLVNDVLSLEKVPWMIFLIYFSPDIYWMSIFLLFFFSILQRNNSVNQVIKNMSPTNNCF